jgi:hypothetical protein
VFGPVWKTVRYLRFLLVGKKFGRNRGHVLVNHFPLFPLFVSFRVFSGLEVQPREIHLPTKHTKENENFRGEDRMPMSTELPAVDLCCACTENTPEPSFSGLAS